jgi:hypothetical protein
MANRGAVFGISVVTEVSDATQSIVPFGDDRLIVRVPPLVDGEGWDYTALGVALECARWKSLMARSAVGSLDVARLSSEIDRAVSVTNRFTEVKKKITAGKTHLNDISDYLDDMRLQLVASLQSVRDVANSACSTREAA